MSVVAQIVMARLRDPDRSAEAIATEMAQRQLRVSVRSIERTLSEFGLTRGRNEHPTVSREKSIAR
jgi:hypothetical protein